MTPEQRKLIAEGRCRWCAQPLKHRSQRDKYECRECAKTQRIPFSVERAWRYKD